MQTIDRVPRETLHLKGWQSLDIEDCSVVDWLTDVTLEHGPFVEPTRGSLARNHNTQPTSQLCHPNWQGLAFILKPWPYIPWHLL